MSKSQQLNTGAMLRNRIRAGEEDSQADGYFADQDSVAARRPASRIVAIPLSQILPDRYQPRPILPPEIKRAFFSGQLNWREAAEEFLRLGPVERGKATIFTERVQSLLNMGNTFDEHGQIKPATGAWQRSGQQPMFYLETGERRFWAKALQAVEGEQQDEPTLEVREILGERLSRERQVIENIHAERPTAVARAREVAALILSEYDMHPDMDDDSGEYPDEYEYYREALKIKEERIRTGVWEKLSAVMGLGRSIMVRHLKILHMPNELLDLADIHRVSERVLREIVAMPTHQWERALDQAISAKFTVKEVQHYVETGITKKAKRSGSKKTVSEKAASRIRSFLKLTQRRGVRENLGAIATDFYAEVDDDDETLYAAQILEELAKHLRSRAKG